MLFAAGYGSAQVYSENDVRLCFQAQAFELTVCLLDTSIMPVCELRGGRYYSTFSTAIHPSPCGVMLVRLKVK